MADPMPFSQHWEVRIPVSIERLGNLGSALQNSFDQFKPGDLIQVTAYADRSYFRLLETADFRVVSSNARILETVQITETVKVPAVLPQNDPASLQNLSVRSIRGAFEVVDQLGNILECFVDEQQAKTFVGDYKKVTAPVSQPVPLDKKDWYVKKSVNGKWTVRNGAGELIREFSRRDEADSFIAEPQAA